jgi:hypothetical protein
MFRRPKHNSVEPPWYGPVRPVVWEGWRREASPYPDQSEQNWFGKTSTESCSQSFGIRPRLRAAGRRTSFAISSAACALDQPIHEHLSAMACRSVFLVNSRERSSALSTATIISLPIAPSALTNISAAIRFHNAGKSPLSWNSARQAAKRPLNDRQRRFAIDDV